MLEELNFAAPKCRPIRIAQHDSDTGPRIGGSAPERVVPKLIRDETRYFATITVDEENSREMSIFTSLLYGASEQDSIWSQKGVLQFANNRAVEIVLHDASPRSASPAVPSDLSSHALLFDRGLTEGETPDDMWGGHKIGGYPLFNWVQDMSEKLEPLSGSGYFHLLQFSFPSADDANIKGNWPFGEYQFHLFAKDHGGSCEFCYCWG